MKRRSINSNRDLTSVVVGAPGGGVLHDRGVGQGVGERVVGVGVGEDSGGGVGEGGVSLGLSASEGSEGYHQL